MILLFNIVSKQSPEVQSSVSTGRTTVLCLKEKAPVLDGLCSDFSYSAVGQRSVAMNQQYTDLPHIPINPS